MTFTNSTALDSVCDDGLEELRAAFLARLRNDRVQFVALSAALARAEEDAGSIFLDLRDRAHKIRGGAAVFQIAKLSAAARELEIAAIAADIAHAGNCDAKVWEALVALVRVMGDPDQPMAHDCEAAAKLAQRRPNYFPQGQ